MIEVITAIALLCQVTGTTDIFYDPAKRNQIKCHQKLLKCVENDVSTNNLEIRFRSCVLKGGY